MRRPAEPSPAPPLRLRRMTPADLDRVVAIEKDGFAHPWSRELVERELAHAWSRIVLAVEDGPDGQERILGFVIYWVVHDEIHVLNVATAPEARRRGVGRALMDAAADEGRRRGATLVTLEVRRSNAAALALYRALGYRQVGVRPGYYAEEREDAIVMVLDLE